MIAQKLQRAVVVRPAAYLEMLGIGSEELTGRRAHVAGWPKRRVGDGWHYRPPDVLSQQGGPTDDRRV